MTEAKREYQELLLPEDVEYMFLLMIKHFDWKDDLQRKCATDIGRELALRELLSVGQMNEADAKRLVGNAGYVDPGAKGANEINQSAAVVLGRAVYVVACLSPYLKEELPKAADIKEVEKLLPPVLVEKAEGMSSVIFGLIEEGR